MLKILKLYFIIDNYTSIEYSISVVFSLLIRLILVIGIVFAEYLL